MSSIILPRLVGIVAMDRNRAIGKGGTLPWHFPEDLKFFKETTSGGTILMGRKTFDSIGKPLPKRRNLVLSRSMEPREGVEIIRSLEELGSLFQPEDQVFVIGGAEVFKMLLPGLDALYVTHVDGDYEGDAFMPPFEHCFTQKSVVKELPGLTFCLYEE